MINGSTVNAAPVNGSYKAVLYLLAESFFDVGTSGNNKFIAKLEGASGYNVVEDSVVTTIAAFDGSSSYSVESTGNNKLVAALEAITGYDYETSGETRLVALVVGEAVLYSVENESLVTVAASMTADVNYVIESYGRANVVKYSQEVLEEFACVTYNVEMVDNVFVVSPIENSVTADPTIVFEVNRC